MAKQPQDDLFEGGSMSFGEHLEELRVCLFRSIFGVILGCLIGLYAADRVVRFFESPLETALTKHYLKRAMKEVTKDFDGNPPPEMVRTILVDQLLPEKVNVEPAQVFEALGGTYPRFVGETRISGSDFVPADFQADADLRLVKLLIEQKEKTTASPVRRLWQLLSDEQHEKLAAWAKADKSLTPQERAELLEMLNGLVAKSEVHDSAEFASLPGLDADTIKSLREGLKAKAEPVATQRLNKLLITSALDSYFRAPRVNLVSFYNWRPVKVRYQVLNAQEAFMIYLKASLVTGVVLASPWVFYQVWIFVAAGLYPHEKNQVFLYLPISMLLFLAGASLAFTFVFQPVLDFLFQFNEGLNAEFDPRIGEWLSFVLILPLGFGISFQLPLVMLFVNRLGLVTVETYIQQWRMAILIIFVVAMVLTPADPVSMLLMALPLCGLYVLGIGMCMWMPRSRNPFDQAYEPSA